MVHLKPSHLLKPVDLALMTWYSPNVLNIWPRMVDGIIYI